MCAVAPTRVACDARALGDASAFRGIGTYLRLLLAHLARCAEVEVTALSTAAAPLPDGVRRATVARHAPDRWATAEHQLRLPSDLARLRPDVVHSPALDPPRRAPAPWVQTVHDLLPLVSPDRGLATERRRWRRWAPRVRRAAAVIAVSRHAADQAVELLGVAPARLHVIPPAPDPALAPPDDRSPEARCPDALAAGARPAGVPERAGAPFVLVVGEYGPHKGYREAVEVADRLADAGLPHEMWIAGRVTPWTRAAVDAAVGEARHGGRVRVLGWVPDLGALYRAAAVVAIPSRHEGFGFPAVEAMATATPVVAFRNSATAEVVEGGGRLVDDGDTAAMAAALRTLLTDRRAWTEASEAARRRSRGFDWERAARQHAEVFRSVAL